MGFLRTIRNILKWGIATPIAVLLWSVFVLGCPAAAGFIYYKTGSMLLDYVRARQWVEVPATIQTLNLETHADAESTSYRVTCTYTYPFREQEFTGHRVGLSGFADNIGSWQQQTYERLIRVQTNHQSVPCFVNPARPEQALLDREIRYPLIVFLTIGVLAFGGVGLLIDWGVVEWLFKKRSRKQAQRKPDQPWLANPQWAAGVIPSGLKSKAVIATVAALFWIITSAPAIVLLPGALRQGWQYSAIGGIVFTAIGVLLAVFAYRCVSRLRRFGYSRFELDTIPGVIGGHLRGQLVLIGDVTGIGEVHVKLTCKRTVTESDGGERSTQQSTVWENAQTLQATNVTFGHTELALPVEFNIPADCPESAKSKNDMVNWHLAVIAPTTGVDLNLKFEVPVFRTSESPPLEVNLSGPPLPDTEVPKGIERGVSPEGLQQLVVHCNTGWGDRFATLVGAALFFVATLAIAYFMPDFGCMRYAFVAICGGVFLLFLSITIMSTGTWRTAFDIEAIKVERRIGPVRRRKMIPIDTIRDVSFSQSAGKGAQKWFQITVHLNTKRKTTISNMVTGDQAADWFVRQVRKYLESRRTA